MVKTRSLLSQVKAAAYGMRVPADRIRIVRAESSPAKIPSFTLEFRLAFKECDHAPQPTPF